MFSEHLAILCTLKLVGWMVESLGAHCEPVELQGTACVIDLAVPQRQPQPSPRHSHLWQQQLLWTIG